MDRPPDDKWKGKRVLVVDDELCLRGIIEAILVHSNFQPVLAENVEQAQEMVLSQAVDLVICDLNMPGQSGLDFYRWLKGNIVVPFILMTGSAALEELEEAEQFGITGILQKPFMRGELLARVAGCLEAFAEPGLKTTFTSVV